MPLLSTCLYGLRACTTHTHVLLHYIFSPRLSSSSPPLLLSRFIWLSPFLLSRRVGGTPRRLSPEMNFDLSNVHPGETTRDSVSLSACGGGGGFHFNTGGQFKKLIKGKCTLATECKSSTYAEKIALPLSRRAGSFHSLLR